MRLPVTLRSRLLGALFALLGVVAAADASASMVELLELETLVKEADQILLARVMRHWSHYDDRGRIVTDYQMQVERSEKGDAVPGSAVVVRKLGGVVDGIGMRVEGEPGYDDGETVLMFGSRGKRAYLRPIGMGQGAVRVFEQDGLRWARTDTQGMALIARGGDKAKARAAVSEPRKLDELLREVGRLVASQQ
jgi:hypothetical protein